MHRVATEASSARRRAGRYAITLAATVALAVSPAIASAQTPSLGSQTTIEPTATIGGTSVSISGGRFHGYAGTLASGDNVVLVDLTNGDLGAVAILPSLAADSGFGSNGLISFGPPGTNEQVLGTRVAPGGSAVDLFLVNTSTGVVSVKRSDSSGNLLGTSTFTPPAGVQANLARSDYLPSFQGAPTMLLEGNDTASGNGLIVPIPLAQDGTPSLGTAGWHLLSGTGYAPQHTYFGVEGAEMDQQTGQLAMSGTAADLSGATPSISFDVVLMSLPSMNLGIANFNRGTRTTASDVYGVTVEPNGDVLPYGRYSTASGVQGFGTLFDTSPSAVGGFNDITLAQGSDSVMNRVLPFGSDVAFVGEQPAGSGHSLVAGLVGASCGQPDGAPLVLTGPGAGNDGAVDTLLAGSTLTIFSSSSGINGLRISQLQLSTGGGGCSQGGSFGPGPPPWLDQLVSATAQQATASYNGGGAGATTTPAPPHDYLAAMSASAFAPRAWRLSTNLRSLRLTWTDPTSVANTDTLSLTLSQIGAADRGAKRVPKPATFVDNPVVITLRPGERRTVTMSLPRSATRYLRTHRAARLKAALAVKVTDPQGDDKRFTVTHTLVTPARSTHRKA